MFRLQPVTEAEAPQYFSIVTEPMDLSTIAARAGLLAQQQHQKKKKGPAADGGDSSRFPCAYQNGAEGIARLREDVALIWRGE